MSLKSMLEMERGALSDRVVFIDLLKESLEGEAHDYRLLEMLCDGLSISNKFIREIGFITSNNPIFKPEDFEEEQVILFKEDQAILETIVVSRGYLREDLRKLKNISVFLH